MKSLDPRSICSCVVIFFLWRLFIVTVAGFVVVSGSPSERRRIEDHGGFVEMGRVIGILAVRYVLCAVHPDFLYIQAPF